MKFSSYDASKFRRNVKKALITVEKVLASNRNDKLKTADDVAHSYQNKYDLVNLMTNTAIIAIINTFEQFGLTKDILQSLNNNNNNNNSMTLCFQPQTFCTFIKQNIVQQESKESLQSTTTATTTTSSGASKTKSTTISKIVMDITEYHWQVDYEWELFLYSGSDKNNNKIVLSSRKSSSIIVTRGRKTLHAGKTFHPPKELSLTWLLQQININEGCAKFRVDTVEAKTPRRNDQVEQAVGFMVELTNWAVECGFFFESGIDSSFVQKHDPASDVVTNTPLLKQKVTSDQLFCPILPILQQQQYQQDETEENKDDKVASAGTTRSVGLISYKTHLDNDNSDAATSPDTKAEMGPVISSNDMISLLNEQVRLLIDEKEKISKIYPSNDDTSSLISSMDATHYLLHLHLRQIHQHYIDGVGHIEQILKDQLIKAIGKQIQPEDMEQYVKYHNAKFLNPAPKSFCYAIRRPDHYPDGLLAIEQKSSNNISSSTSKDIIQPIQTMAQPVISSTPLQITLSAATTLELTGDKYLHGWMLHRFQDSQTQYQLIARARQFSSFILMIGTMVGPNEMEPKDAMILQNKDELMIPLLLDELPTAKEFKKAIESMSPEQQQFAKAYRSMQLDSSVFALCVIQIKPQLERLLGLPNDSLTKEMELTQDLMELFIEYQVPSDMLSYDGSLNGTTFENEVSGAEKLSVVKGHVEAVQTMIKKSKEKQLADQTMKADMKYELKERRVYSDSDSDSDSDESEEDALGGGMDMFGGSDSGDAESSADGESDDDGDDCSDGESSVSSDDDDDDDNDDDDVKGNGNEDEIDERERDDNITKPSKSTTQSKAIDVTLIPKMLDALVEKHDNDNALRSTIITTGYGWERTRQENLLTDPENNKLNDDNKFMERNKAFDLLDALSRSGSLQIACSELHVVVAMTHRFDNDLIGTVVQDNINPIEKIDKSTLLLASAIHGGVPVRSLVKDTSMLPKLEDSFPLLFDKK